MAFSEEVASEVKAAARAEGLDENAMLAVVEVESGGRAYADRDFPGEKRPLILYEYHVFHRNLPPARRKEALRRRLASVSWGEIKYPVGQKARYALLERAKTIDEGAAYAACSYGVGQVLGENWEWLGYPSPRALYEEARSGVGGQVRLMALFIDRKKLTDELNDKDWTGFARGYNGARHFEHNYAGRMKAAYERITGKRSPVRDDLILRIGANGEAVARLQRSLRGLGRHLIVDGDFGPATRRAVQDFQREVGLAPDGVVGPKTMGRIEAMQGVNIA